MSEVLIEAKNLKKYFKVPAGSLHAVDDVSFSINRGETLGLVGESGCGKSTVGRTLLRLIPHTDGEVLYNGENILKYSNARMREMRTKMQMIFQDPYSCLDPRKTIGQIIAEPLLINKVVPRKEINEHVLELMSKSSLDVSIQAQILNLLQDLQDTMHLTYLFVSHDLSVVRHISNRIVVMYLGKIVEVSPSHELFKNPIHPYTRALLSAIPVAKYQNDRPERILLKGDVPSPVNPKPGCRFANRCWMAKEICHEQEPCLKECCPGHQAACHFV